ncbi:MAG: hypothetical protein ACP5UZ_07600 [Thermoplasmata archaeon]
MTRHKGLKVSPLQVPIYGRIEQKIAEDLEKYSRDSHVPKSYLMNEALKHYLASQLLKAHTHSSGYLKGNITRPIRDIIETLKNLGFDNETTQEDIEGVIRSIRGNDRRTIIMWRDSLEKIGFIREKVRKNYKIAVYSMDWSAVDESLWPDSLRKEGIKLQEPEMKSKEGSPTPGVDQH